jgi:hypothetical protein
MGRSRPSCWARTSQQLEDNLGVLETTLSTDQLARLDARSAIELGFPHDLLTAPMNQLAVSGGVKVSRHRYSVDCRYAGKTVSLRTYADRVVIMAEGKIVGEHVRSFLTAMGSAIAWSAAASSTLRSVRAAWLKRQSVPRPTRCSG